MNKNSRIVTRVTRTGNLRTETRYRDDGRTFAATTDERNDRTRLVIGRVGEDTRPLIFNGHEARTLYRVLSEHYYQLNKEWMQ